MTSIYDGVETSSKPQDEEPSVVVKRNKNRDPLTTTELRQGKQRLFQIVERAFQTLEEAMEKADYSTSVKAALGVLDRTGFGPKSSMDVTTTNIDLSNLTKEELAARAQKVAELIRAAQSKSNVIDVVPTESIPVESTGHLADSISL